MLSRSQAPTTTLLQLQQPGWSNFGRGHTSYTAYDIGGNLLETGLVGGGFFALTSTDIADLRFDNGDVLSSFP